MYYDTDDELANKNKIFQERNENENEIKQRKGNRNENEIKQRQEKENDKEKENDNNNGVFITLNGKNNNNLIISIYKTKDIQYELNNKIIDKYFIIDRYNEFYDFLTNHPLLQKNEDDTYTIDSILYKKLIKVALKQSKFFITKLDISKSESLFNKETSIISPIIKNINIKRGHKVQKYSLDGKLLNTYNGIRDATRNESISDTKLKSAIANKTIYIGHRWLFLDRTLDDSVVQEIGDSVEINTPKNAFVAMLDIDKTKIVNVFQNQKEASSGRKLKSSSAIFKSITNGNLSSGHYFTYYDNCSDELKNRYINTGGILPKEYVNKGIAIKQLNHITNEVIREFPSILDVQKHFQVSSKTIKKAIETGEIIKNFKWSM
jgi:hypothetical protein